MHSSTRGTVKRVMYLALVAGGLAITAPAHADDSPWLYGIHFYGDAAGSIVESMTGGKGIWSLEIVQTDSDVWWGAEWQRDNRFSAMVDRGHTLIVRIERNWGETVPFPEHRDQYLVDVQAAATALSDVCHVWQIGNEMNILAEWGGSELTAETYVDMYRQIRAAIKSVDSPLGEQIVLVGPVSPGAVIPGVRHTDGNEYLGQMCDRLTPDEVDGFAIHAYAAPWYDATAARADLQSGYVSQLALIDEKGYTGKPVHMTEWNRRVEPITEAMEAQSAQFLHGAFTDLHVWNETPGTHPVSSACWFIYDDMPGWEYYSILNLRDYGPPGPDNDLWDAFQYACTLDYPSGTPGETAPPRMYEGEPPGANIALGAIGATTDSDFGPDWTGEKAIDGVIDAGSKWVSDGSSPPHWLQLDLGRVRPLSGMVVRHAGAGGEPEYYNTEAFQLQTADGAAGPWEIDSLVFNVEHLDSTARRYYVPRFVQHVCLFVTDPGIDNYTRIPEFEVYEAALGDFDDDGDVDLSDAARFQACFAGEDVDQRYPDCFHAHFDADGDVDGTDYAAFAGAFQGPG